MESYMAEVRECIPLVATNRMRIAGIQGVYGDPCGLDIVPVSLMDTLRPEGIARLSGKVILIDAGSVTPLFEVLGKFKAKIPDASIVVIGTDADDTYVECVIAAGARGFIGANALAAEFRVALENVREGVIWAPRKVLSRMVAGEMRDRTHADRPGIVHFTPRENQIIRLLIRGHANREIGDTLGIDSVTVKAHIGRLMRKAGVGNRIELTMYALRKRARETSAREVTEIR
jgi:DNA-binding NarL/FixJ family response regulator